MRNKRATKLLLVVVVVLSILLAQYTFTLAAGVSTDADYNIEYLKSVIDMIKEKHKGEITDKQLVEGALKGMFDTMDPYTTYFTPEQAEVFLNDMKATYEGIGIMMTKSDEYIVVTKVFPLSPAEKAGLLQGDKIASVNGESIIGEPAEKASSLIKGEAGTSVTLGIIRSGYSEVLKFDVVRDEIKISPVTYEIKGDIGYIKIDVFNSNTDEFFTKALKEMGSNNIKKIILDLRNNPGGEVKQAVEVAKNFVPEGLITKLDFQSEEDKDIEYYSHLKEQKYKLAVLVNEVTASASEILAGAIQDTGVGTLIGTRTFGKAKVQSLVPLLSPEAYKKYKDRLGEDVVNAYDLLLEHKIMPLKSEVIGWSKITTGVYTTPKGRMIDGTGLEPDIYVENSDEAGNVDIHSIQKLTKTSKPGLNDEGIDIYNAEKILKLLGYDVDTPDMKMDKKTFDAVWKFRVDCKLYPGGVLDFTTQQALNDKLDELILKIDKQYVKALEILNE